jgi:iron complex transport system substrate-binding protein
MPRRSALLWALVLAGLPLRRSASQEGPYFLGEKRPQEIPRRIVSLAPNLTEILFALGAGPLVVGVTRYDDYPPEVQGLPKVGGFVDPSVEAILALRPDLVVCVPNSGSKERMEVLARMGIPVQVLPAYGLEDVFAAVRSLGEVVGKRGIAEDIHQGLRNTIQRIQEGVKGKVKPKVLLVYGHRPLVVAGPKSFGGSLLEIAGGENAVVSSVPYPVVPMEEILGLNPEVIIDASMSGRGAEMSAIEVQEFWDRWKALRAVRSGRVHLFDSSIWFRAGPRIGEGLEQLFLLLHPAK